MLKQGQTSLRRGLRTGDSGKVSEGREDQRQGACEGCMDKCPFSSANVLLTCIYGQDKSAKELIKGSGKESRQSRQAEAVTISTHARLTATSTREGRLNPERRGAVGPHTEAGRDGHG